MRTAEMNRHRVSLQAAIDTLTPEQRVAEVFRHGCLSVELYAPVGSDRQTPHRQDEVYIVQQGQGRFECAGETQTFGTGDVLFAAAGTEHRFLDFSDDFRVWVVFFGPDGGERPGSRTVLGQTFSERGR
jgi:mannose-6-phosphate isomerase-like protein (cupin superfamily)